MVYTKKTFYKVPNGKIHSFRGLDVDKKLNLNFKDALIPLGLSCISFFHQIKVNEPLLHAAVEFWIPTRDVFHFGSLV